MDICDLIDNFASENLMAHVYRESTMSYKELNEKSNSLGAFLIERFGEDKTPIAVYGHKEHLMLVCFFACIKSGHPYIPIDASTPVERLGDIIENSKARIVFNVADKDVKTENCDIMPLMDIEKIIQDYEGRLPDNKYRVKDDDIHYIIYTSGSTGKPKGVRITSNCLKSFVDWSKEYLEELSEKHCVIMNQAPFSFDLSVMDLYLSMFTGSTLYSIDKNMIANLKELFAYLRSSNISVWVSTPSFAELCLSDSSFRRELLPELKIMLFCGETLTNNCVNRLQERFEGLKVINLYGPTEATVAVTGVEIDRNMCETINPLPVGYVKEDCEILIVGEGRDSKTPDKSFIEFNGLFYEILKDSERGEIIIGGESVSPGYLNNEEVTKKVFTSYNINGSIKRYYRTGDEGYLNNGLLYYNGRIDFQVKLNGFRIELEDIESNLLSIKFIDKAVVLPILKEGKLHYLAAVVTLNEKFEEKDFAISLKIKENLKERLPEYMIPRKIVIKENLPMTTNGKIDRKLLTEELK